MKAGVQEAQTVLGSLTRITDFDEAMPEFEPVPRDGWARGDYVAVEMVPGEHESYTVETPDGSPVDIWPGDILVGAFGTRAATLEATGSWEAVGEDMKMHSLTSAGVIGRMTSKAIDSGPVIEVRYVGHAARGGGDGEKLNMSDFVTSVEPRALEVPVILIIGTSMDSGKTVAAVAIVRELVAMGLKVAGAKVTGVGRLRDTLAMKHAGASDIFDFVDVGFPSSVVPTGEYREGLGLLTSKIAAVEPDVVVIEAGASPLEPYRGEIAMEVLADSVTCTVLCASDPYAVMGVMNAFEMKPDLVTGRCTGTLAGIELVDRLVGVPAINMLDESSAPAIREFLRKELSLE
jgi:hypothetical protein